MLKKLRINIAVPAMTAMPRTSRSGDIGIDFSEEQLRIDWFCTEALIFFAKKREKVWLNEKKAVPLHPEIKN